MNKATFNRAKSQAKRLMVAAARRKGVITYSELCRRVTAVRLNPRSAALTAILHDICREEHAAGRGMLGATVVSAQTLLPGNGFYDLAAELGGGAKAPGRGGGRGKTPPDRYRVWHRQWRRVLDYWNRPTAIKTATE